MGENITCFYGRLTSLGLLILLREVEVLSWKKGFRRELQTAKMAQVIFMDWPLPSAAPRGSPRASLSPRPPRCPCRGLHLSRAPLLPTAPHFPLRSSLSPLPQSAPCSPPSLGRFGQSRARCGPPPPFGPPLPWAPGSCQQHPRAVCSLPTTPLSLGFHSSSPFLPRGSPDPSTPLRLPPRVSPSWRHLTQQVICTIASEEPGAGSPVYTCGVFQEGYGGLTFHR